MNNIQRLIIKWNADFLQAHKDFRRLRDEGNKECLSHQGYALACKNHIEELTLLLNTENENGGKKDGIK